MSNFNENQQLLDKILKGRQYILQEITHLDIWAEDEIQANQKMEVVFSLELKDGWLKISNKEGNGSYGFISIDGTNGVFRNSKPPVRNENLFKFLKTYFINSETGERKTRIETAGPCDCLLLDIKWRYSKPLLLKSKLIKFIH